MNKIIEYFILTFLVILVIGSLLGVLMDRPIFVSYAYSNSMTPTISKGDVFFINPFSRNPNVGDIIVFNAGGTWTVHRVVGVVSDGYLTKGDNNVATDQLNKEIPPIKRSQIGGKVITFGGKPVVIPKLGLYIDKDLTPKAKMFLAGALVILGVILFTLGDEKNTRKKRSKFIQIKFKTLYLISSMFLLIMISVATFVSWQVFPIEYAVTSAGGQREGWYLPGETFEQKLTIQNNNFYPMLYFVSPESSTIEKISHTEFTLNRNEETALSVTITAPEETSIFTAKVKVNAYMPLLPKSLISMLYAINPMMPLLAILAEVSLFLGVFYILSGIGDEDILRIRKKRTSLFRGVTEVFRI